MGSWAEFRCGSCSYEVMVSGKDDMGMLVNTTVLCEDCEKLYDVVTFSRPGGPRAERKPTGAMKPECPEPNERTFRRRTHPDVCSRCDKTMVLGEKVTIWD